MVGRHLGDFAQELLAIVQPTHFEKVGRDVAENLGGGREVVELDVELGHVAEQVVVGRARDDR